MEEGKGKDYYKIKNTYLMYWKNLNKNQIVMEIEVRVVNQLLQRLSYNSLAKM